MEPTAKLVSMFIFFRVCVCVCARARACARGGVCVCVRGGECIFSAFFSGGRERVIERRIETSHLRWADDEELFPLSTREDMQIPQHLMQRACGPR